MTVDEFVVAISSTADPPPLVDILEVLTEYVKALLDAGIEPIQDPAVLVLGFFVSFHTHADINTNGGLMKLIKQCEDRIHAHEAHEHH